MEAEVGFNKSGVEEECEQRSYVRECKETVRDGGGFRPSEPNLQEWAGRCEQEKG
jgi:hypothetical protein